MILLLPIFFVPIFPNYFLLPKIIIIVLSLSIIFYIEALRIPLSKETFWYKNDFDIPVILLTLAYILSGIFASDNKMEAFFLPGIGTLIPILTLFYFFLNSLKFKEEQKIKNTLIFSSLLSNLFVIFSFLSLYKLIPQLPDEIKNETFSPMGSFLPLIVFNICILPISFSLFLKEKDSPRKILWGVINITILLGIIISSFQFFQKEKQNFFILPPKASWSIAIDSLKESPLFGAGPANYLTAFNRFKPIQLNQDKILWNKKFTTASNFYLTSITETGGLGLFAWIVFFITVYRVWKKIERPEIKTSLALILIILALLPASLSLLLLLFILLSLAGQTSRFPILLSPYNTKNLAYKIPSLIASLLILVSTTTLNFFFLRWVWAEHLFYKSMKASIQNNVKETFDLINKTIRTNPYIDRYHIFNANITLILIQNILSKPQDQITDQDKQILVNLIQQAINEGKAAVALNKRRSENWEILARVYQNIINLAQGADNFAIQSLNQAIALSPFDPNLRIALGGIYYSMGNFEEAQKVFELAVLAKPDLANAHYNLAAALRERGQIDKAIKEMEIVISLVEKDSKDYNLATKVLENLKEKKKDTSIPQGESLSTPTSTTTSQNKIEPVKLEEESSPPNQ